MRGMFAFVPGLVLSQACDAVTLHVDLAHSGALQSALVDLAQQRLEASGLVIDREHVWLNVAGALPATNEIDALPVWSSVDGIPLLPLTFELRPAGVTRPTKATLGVRLQRNAWIAQRRLRKGSQVSCTDFATGLRDVRDVPRNALPAACEIGSEMGADIAVLRDVAAGDVVRVGDIGRALDVQAGTPVKVSASSGGISVTTTATALADARVGDRIDVRLQRPTRTLRARVTGRGTVQLADDAP
jgi:flagella basal body P-ring formation protein FlgA